MTSEVPIGSTTSGSSAADPSVQATTPRKPGLKKRFAGLSLGGAINQAGMTLTNKEARVISRQTGRPVAEVMSRAVDSGVTLGSNLVNKFNAGKLGPNLQNTGGFWGYSSAPGQSERTQAALQNLQPLRGVSMPSGSVYAGSTGITKDGQTTFNPIVLPKAVLKGAMSNISGSLGYTAPTQSGTAGEVAATTGAGAPAAPSAKASPNRNAAKTKAQKMIAKRRTQGKGKQNR